MSKEPGPKEKALREMREERAARQKPSPAELREKVASVKLRPAKIKKSPKKRTGKFK
jgi:hypothetical protein